MYQEIVMGRSGTSKTLPAAAMKRSMDIVG